jgi:hypothetical protein
MLITILNITNLSSATRSPMRTVKAAALTSLIIAAAAAFAVAISHSASASLTVHADYPVLGEYKALAQSLIEPTQKAATPEELQALATQTQALIALGTEITHLYAAKNPTCAEQLKAFQDALPTMADLPLAEVDAKYHKGAALPQAPRLCYFGRSVVVHPVMNLIRLKGAWDAEAREHALEELEEVIEHVARIQKNLDSPQAL